MSKLVVISGPSGVGKGTIVKLLQEKYKNEGKKLYLSISCTTRLPREGEVDGVHYYFISEDEFNKRVDNNQFLEYNKYGTGKFYGTPKDKVIDYLNNGYDVILEIDVNGYKIVKKNCPECLGIFITASSLEEVEQRLRDRGTETEEVIKKRVETARSEMKEMDLYDHIIINENNKSADAMEKIYNIIRR